MNNALEKLQEYGCDIQGALTRTLGDEELLLNFIDMVLEDRSVDELYNAIIAEDISKAFDAAHSLKGISINVGLNPIYDEVVKIVEPLRNNCIEGLLPLCNNLKDIREKIKEVKS